MDAVVVVDSIGNPKKIASAAARISQNPRDLMMAENVAKVIASTPYFKDGFSFRRGRPLPGGQPVFGAVHG